MPPRPSTPSSRRQQLTLAQLAAYDDILTDALVDHTYYWTTIPKNRPSYHPSRGVREEEISKIIQTHVIIDQDPALAEEKLLATDGLRKFYNGLKTDKEKEDFRAHLQRYIAIYLPDCPFEVNATNRYTIVTHEASITARRYIRPNETIRYLSGIQVVITPEEEAEMALRKKDFSIVVSSRNKCTSLFMGPARFANHDCGANARLVTKGQAGIEIIACRAIDADEEITVTYGENYFGEDNCECLCHTCEDNQVNGWKNDDGGIPVNKSIEGDLATVSAQGYSLRRRRRDESACGASSRTPSATPDIRPRVPKRSKSQRNLGERASTIDSPFHEHAEGSRPALKRKRDIEPLATPPITPAKQQKTTHNQVVSAPSGSAESSAGSEKAFGESPPSSEATQGDALLTDVTSPPEDTPEPVIHSPKPTPINRAIEVLKQEDATDDVRVQDAPAALSTPEASQPATAPGDPQSEEAQTATISEMLELAVTGSPSTRPNIIEHGPVTIQGLEIATDRLPSPVKSQESGPATPATSPLDASDSVALAPASPTPETPNPIKRGRGRPRKLVSPAAAVKPGRLLSGRRRRSSAGTPESSPPPPRRRTPGDYTLTPLLLSEPHTAWIHCMNCGVAFVQQNAYYTKSSCPRCERHSKLYGYIWPKTEPSGKGDGEERVLDHRLIHRFLDAEGEAKVRGRRYGYSNPGRDTADRETGEDEESALDLGRGRKRTRAETVRDEAISSSADEDGSGLRRSGRARRTSARKTSTRAGRAC